MYVVVGAPAALGKSDAAFQCNNDKDYHVALHTYNFWMCIQASYNILHFYSFKLIDQARRQWSIKDDSGAWKMTALFYHGPMFLQLHMNKVPPFFQVASTKFIMTWYLICGAPHIFINQKPISKSKVNVWHSAQLGPNVSTTPITAMGRRQCLPLSII